MKLESRPWLLLLVTSVCFSLAQFSVKMCGKRLPASEKLWFRALSCFPVMILTEDNKEAPLLTRLAQSSNKLYLVILQHDLHMDVACYSIHHMNILM